MAEIGHSLATQATTQTNSSATFTTGTGCEILGSNLDASSDDILIFVGLVFRASDREVEV